MSDVDKTLRSVGDLVGAGLVAPEQAKPLAQVANRYAIAITPAIAALMPSGTDAAADPIARQFLPDERELSTQPEEAADPLAEADLSPVPGVVHRYPDRVLLKLTHTCPVYCRFCFRREVVGPGGEAPLVGEAFERAIAYVADTPGIWEVILTGGDPLILSPRRIHEVTERLSGIPHVKVLRWHSRVPVVDPQRITQELVSALRSRTKAVYVALHANHPREFTPQALEAIARLVDGGIPMLSQTVLLKGVNDDPATLAELMRRFVEARVKPYYLHHMDKAPGTSHFRATIAEGQALMRALRGRVSGLAQPTYVLDIPGGHGKVPIGPGYLDDTFVADPFGGTHERPERV